jgi:hypothetical protein
MLHPAETKPSAAFADTMSAQPAPTAAVDQFKIQLSTSSGVKLGWLGQNNNGWATLVTDVKQALTIEQYPFDGKMYYRIKDSNKYMSVGTTPANKAYVGFYLWASASSFTRRGRNLVSDLNGQALSIYSTDNAYIFAWDAYTILDVDFQQM